MKRLVAAVALAGGLAAATSSWAWANGAPIGPNQHFLGLVNGHHDNVTVRVLCPGPSRTGHVISGQTLSVTRVAGGGGFTGSSGDAVFARFATNPANEGLVFRTYDTPQDIPNSWIVPCSGTGRVVYRPVSVLSSGTSAKPDVVTVNFLNLGV